MKTTLNQEELIRNLCKSKKVILDSDERVILYKIGYLNLITPYKHFFHKGKNSKGEHIYDNEVLLDEYYKCYKVDKHNSNIVREIIFDFEKLIKSEINNELSTMFNGHYVNEVNSTILNDIESSIQLLETIREREVDTSKIEFKIEMYNNLKEKFSENIPFYLIINKLNLSQIYSLLSIESISTSNIELFKSKFNSIRILRNSLSHGDTLLVYLCRLDDVKYKETMRSIKKMNSNNLSYSEYDSSWYGIGYYKFKLFDNCSDM